MAVSIRENACRVISRCMVTTRLPFPFPVGRKGQASLDVFRLQIREIGEHFLLGHAGGKVFEYVIYGDPQTPNTGFSPSFSRLHRDAFTVGHGCELTRAVP